MLKLFVKASATSCGDSSAHMLASAAICLHLAGPHNWTAARCFAQAALQHAPASLSSRTDPLCNRNSNSSISSSSSNSNSASTTSKSSSHGVHGSVMTDSTPNQRSQISLHAAGRQASEQLQQWQCVAQLPPDVAQQVLLQHPPLQSYFSSSGFFQPSNYHVNLACLSLHPGEMAQPQHAALRGVLALVPPSMLQTLLEEQPQVQELLLHYQKQQQLRGVAGHDLSQLYDLLLHTLGPLRPQLRQQQLPSCHTISQQQQHMAYPHQAVRSSTTARQPGQQQQQEQPDIRHRNQQQLTYHSFQHVADAVITALGLQLDHQPQSDNRLQQLLYKATMRARNSSSSSNSSSVSPPSTPPSSPSSSSSSASMTRGYTTSTASVPTTVTPAAGLAHALQATARSVALRHKPIHEAAVAAAFAQQLQRMAGLDGTEVLRMLLKRPVMLWQHKTPCPPQQLLSELQQLLPDLAHGHVAQLVLQQPGLLSCRPADLHAAVDVLATRLQLSQAQVAQLVQQHPRLLVHPVKQMLPNIGFLVGLGLTPHDLRAMALKSPRWLTCSLRDLTVHWQFVQQVVKSSRQDLVLFPQLMTLPITTCLGPRVLYARKRQIKLLAPSLAALVGRVSSPEAQQEWKEHKMVPLDWWLSVSERQMCRVMGLNLEDYTRFKAAWGRVDGANWQTGRKNKKGNQQLLLSCVNVK